MAKSKKSKPLLDATNAKIDSYFKPIQTPKIKRKSNESNDENRKKAVSLKPVESIKKTFAQSNRQPLQPLNNKKESPANSQKEWTEITSSPIETRRVKESFEVFKDNDNQEDLSTNTCDKHENKDRSSQTSEVEHTDNRDNFSLPFEVYRDTDEDKENISSPFDVYRDKEDTPPPFEIYKDTDEDKEDTSSLFEVYKDKEDTPPPFEVYRDEEEEEDRPPFEVYRDTITIPKGKENEPEYETYQDEVSENEEDLFTQTKDTPVKFKPLTRIKSNFFDSDERLNSFDSDKSNFFDSDTKSTDSDFFNDNKQEEEFSVFVDPALEEFTVCEDRTLSSSVPESIEQTIVPHSKDALEKLAVTHNDDSDSNNDDDGLPIF